MGSGPAAPTCQELPSVLRCRCASVQAVTEDESSLMSLSFLYVHSVVYFVPPKTKFVSLRVCGDYSVS